MRGDHLGIILNAVALPIIAYRQNQQAAAEPGSQVLTLLSQLEVRRSSGFLAGAIYRAAARSDLQRSSA